MHAENVRESIAFIDLQDSGDSLEALGASQRGR